MVCCVVSFAVIVGVFVLVLRVYGPSCPKIYYIPSIILSSLSITILLLLLLAPCAIFPPVLHLSLCPCPHCLRPCPQNRPHYFSIPSDIIVPHSLPPSYPYPILRELAQQILIPEQLILILTQLYRVPSVLGQQHRVALLHARGDQRSVRLTSTGAYSNHFAFVGLVELGFGEEDTAGRLGLRQDALHQNAVCQGDELTERLWLRVVQGEKEEAVGNARK